MRVASASGDRIVRSRAATSVCNSIRTLRSFSSSLIRSDLISKIAGSEYAADPAGGPPLGGSYSQTSVTTSYAYSVNRGTPTFGAGGVITGGGNSFTFIQNSSDSHNLSITTTSDVVTDSGYDTYSESMSGTETYGPGGAVSGGADSFTWAQTASDNLILTQDYGGTTLGAYTLYDMTVDDQIYQNFPDVGNDILGPSDSILGGGDSYTWGSSRDLVSTITDYGDAATPYLILAYSSDQVGLNQTGTDTLTTNGHIYSTVTYTYNEQTSDNSSVSQSVSGTGWIRQGSASDTYSDTDSGTITISDTTTTSFDSFSVTDNHSISGSISATASYSPGTASWTDTGVDTNGMNASGTKSTTGDVYTFSDTESSTDEFLLGKVIPGSMSGTANDSSSDGFAMTGGTSTGPSGSTFGYTEGSATVTHYNDSGNVTVSSVVSPISLSSSLSLAVQIVMTGPTAATTYTTLGEGTTLTGSNGGASFTETVYAGEGSTAGTPVAALAGSSPLGSAEHQGTSPGGLDSSSGLLSALGGEGVHAMSFTGAEILPNANPTGTSMWLEESNQSGQTPTNWVSHPSGIGYRRGSPGITTSSGGGGSGSHSSSTGPPIAGNAPTMDSGTSDGGAGQELGRLGNFNAGGNENSTATQPGPTPRAQQATLKLLPAGSPAVTNLLLTDPDAEMPVSTLLFNSATDVGAVAPVGVADGTDNRDAVTKWLDGWWNWLTGPGDDKASVDGAPKASGDGTDWINEYLDKKPEKDRAVQDHVNEAGDDAGARGRKAYDMIAKDFPLYAAGVIIEVAATLSGPEELAAIRAAAAAKGLVVQGFKKGGKWILRFARDKAKKELGDATEAQAKAILAEAKAAANKASKSGLSNATRLTSDELATARRLEAKLGRSLKESPHIGAEYIDDLGRTYDALGVPKASQFWNERQFLNSIKEHLRKTNNFTVIDLTGFTAAQIDAVRKYLSTLTPEQLARIIKIGF